ncbi:uncharacterized protein LOC117117365 isoform X2 [Anneissia japonica]|uniref:uncharacterized protein LOC117117365 isoform X2 n=1 Tax=Anneissia japonica TaxID=1529436 RepID=UPI001425AAF5|nr:uncharacterized protein LOC117117365 isoform X2 [Anneissia japonica]
MQQWIKCILVVTWKMAIVEAQCPSEFACTEFAPWCYLIYPTNDGWKYKDPHEVNYDASKDVYELANCYKFIRVNEQKGLGSCINVQQKCEKLGGNITVINSIDEYNQLTNNVLHLLSAWQDNDSTFNVHVQNITLNNIRMGCATIFIEDGILINGKKIVNRDNTTTGTVDTIVCESTDMRPVPATKVMPKSSTKSTTPVYQTTHPLKNKQSQIDAGLNLLMIAIISSIVVIAILIIITFLFILRRKKKKQPGVSGNPSNHLPSTDLPIADGQQDTATVSYTDGVAVHEYSTAENLNQDQNDEACEILDDIHNNIHSPPVTLAADDAYAVPYNDVVEKDVTRDEDGTLIVEDMDSIAMKQNGLGAVMYAVPNKGPKGRKEKVKQSIYEADDTLNVQYADIQQASDQWRREPYGASHGASYENVNAQSLQERNHDSISDTDIHSGNENPGNEYNVPYKHPATGDRQQDHDGSYNMLNIAEVHSKSGKHNMGSANDSGKLNAGDHMPPEDNMYSYVETSVGEANAYDKLQRNTELVPL